MAYCPKDYSARLVVCDIMLPLVIFGQVLNRSMRDNLYAEFVIQLLFRKKLLNEDRTFQDVLKVAIADEVAI
jgi:hypothetical protein